jgi:hypothetical protein
VLAGIGSAGKVLLPADFCIIWLFYDDEYYERARENIEPSQTLLMVTPYNYSLLRTPYNYSLIQ